MAEPVQRFVVRVKPAATHEELHEWQIGTACLFVGESDRMEAERLVNEIIEERAFQVIEYIERATLLKEAVEEVGGRVLAAYREAQHGKPFFLFKADAPVIAKKGGIPYLVPPRLTEEFVDRVVKRAGGRRLTSPERGFDQSPNADYILNGYVVELKDIQVDPIDVETRQRKLVEGLLEEGDPGPLVLPEDPPLEARSILMKAIRRRLGKAKKQLRATRGRLGIEVRGTGVILLNTGMESLGPDEIYEELVKLVSASRTIEFVVLLSSMIATNGFDTYAVFPFHPKESGLSPVHALRSAFNEEVGELMGQWARSGFLPPENPAPPMKPRSHDIGGKTLSIRSSSPRSSMRGESGEDEDFEPE